MINKTIDMLVIEDEEYDVKRIKKTIENPLCFPKIEIVKVVSNGIEALDYLKNNIDKIDVVIMDIHISGNLFGEALIRKIKEIDDTLQIIVLTKLTISSADIGLANSLLEAGAMWYCTKYPTYIGEKIYQPTDFLLNIINAFEKRKLEKENKKSNEKLQRSVDYHLINNEIIGISKSIQDIRNQIEQLANLDDNVLILGESGVGKEVIANNIHYRSQKRKLENFKIINCAAIPPTLLESQLFGVDKGAFTDAKETKKGIFEVSEGGTLFLDEIGEIPIELQHKLLRAIERKEFEHVGGNKTIKVDVRIISATNKNLKKEVKEKRFRNDLYYRLINKQIVIPPLRERKEDIPYFLDHFFKFYSAKKGQDIPYINTDCRQYLNQYEWPGNVRELETVVRNILDSGQKEISRQIIENIVRNVTIESDSNEYDDIRFWDWNSSDIIPLSKIESNFRKKYFQFVRIKSNSNADTARKLGLEPPNFHRMCKELGLKKIIDE